MGRQYAPDTIPEWRATLPGGRWVLAIEDIKDDEPTGTGKYQIKSVLRTLEPMDGLPHFENFVIGNDNDTNGDDPDSWKGPAGQRYIQMLKKAGIEPTGDTEQDFAAVVGQQVGAVITQRVEPAIDRNGQPNQYAGQVRSQADTFFRVGERETGLDASDGAGPVQPVLARPPVRTAPVGAAGRTTTQPPQPARATAPASRGAIGTPRQPPQPAPRPAPASAPRPAPIAQAPKSKQMKCTICNQMVNRDVFADHVEEHEKAAAEE